MTRLTGEENGLLTSGSTLKNAEMNGSHQDILRPADVVVRLIKDGREVVDIGDADRHRGEVLPVWRAVISDRDVQQVRCLRFVVQGAHRGKNASVS